jgi:hypothetical protein
MTLYERVTRLDSLYLEADRLLTVYLNAKGKSKEVARTKYRQAWRRYCRLRNRPFKP